MWYCSQTEKEMFRLSEGMGHVRILSGFARRSGGKISLLEVFVNAAHKTRDFETTFNLGFQVTVGNLSFQPLPILHSKSTIKEPPNKLNIQHVIDLYSIFVGNLPLQAKEPFLKKMFGPFGRVCRIELIKRSSVPRRCLMRFWVECI